ncbi:MAG: hypothetical protein Q8O74_03970 [bacterium]|nr:hypothetical protein [bacterium]
MKNIKALLVLGVLAVLGFIIGPMAGTDPKKLMVLLVVATVVSLCMFSRWWGVLVLIGLAPFYGFARFVLEVPPSMILIKEAIVVLISVSWLLEDVFLKRIKLPQNPVLMPLGIFLFILIIQFLRTGTPMQSLFGLRIYITYVPLFYVVLTEKITNRRLETALFLMVFTAMLTVAYGFWQWSVGLEGLRAFGLAKAGPNISSMGYLRVFSTYAGPEYFAINLILNMLILFGLITASKNVTAKTIYSVCIGLMMFMLAATLYRSMWIMALVAAAAILAITRRYRYIIVMALVLFAVIQYSPPYVKERAGVTFSKDDESYQIRKELYFKTNVINVLENIIGYGVGSSMGNISFSGQTGRVHSSRLLMGGATESWLASVTIELGVIGLLVYLWLMVAVIKTSLYIYKSASEVFWRALSLGFSAFAIGYLVVSSFFLVPACFPAGDLYFWFLTAIMAKKYHELVYETPSEAETVQ